MPRRLSPLEGLIKSSTYEDYWSTVALSLTMALLFIYTSEIVTRSVNYCETPLFFRFIEYTAITLITPHINLLQMFSKFLPFPCDFF